MHSQSMWGSCSIMVLALCCFFLALNVCTNLASADIGCEKTRCSSKTPTIQHPFRLQNTQPQKCGETGFDLSCNENHKTILELPLSVKLIVNKIDYKSHMVHVTVPDECLPKPLFHLNLSSTPFPFLQNPNANYTLF